MPKKDEHTDKKTSRPASGERMPPPLGTDLIAKLQAAVEAAQRKRLAQSATQGDPKTEE